MIQPIRAWILQGTPEKGIFWEEERGGGRTVKDMLIEMTMVEWLDCLKEFEGGGVGGTARKSKFRGALGMRITYGGIQVLREYINIVLKDSDEVDGY